MATDILMAESVAKQGRAKGNTGAEKTVLLPLKILLLEDSLDDCEMLRYALRKEGLKCSIFRVDTMKDFSRLLAEETFDLILSDYHLPGFDGTAALRLVQEQNVETPFLFVTGYLGEDVAIETLKLGATDYVLKDKLSRLGPAVRRALSEREERAQRRSAEVALRTNEERYRLLVERSSDLVVELDANEALIYVSPNAKLILGYRPSELVGEPVFKHVHEEDLNRVRESLVNRSGRTVYRYLRKDRSIVWLESSFGVFTTSTGEQRAVLVARDVTLQKEAEEALKSSRIELQHFSEHLDHLLEEERKRISREIHDELGQLLTGLKFDATWIKLNAPESTEDFKERFDSMFDTLETAIRTVKRISRELRPPQLDALGFCGAVQWDVMQFMKKYGVRMNMNVEPPDFPLDPERSAVLYRVFNEALTNVARHARAMEIDISVAKSSGGVDMSIRDNGVGFARTKLDQAHSLGIVGMRERLRPFNGSLVIDSEPGKGTTVSVRMPIPENKTSGSTDD